VTVQRKAIRGAFAATIVAASTGLEARVFENRVRPFRHNQLPAASIFTRSETAEVNSEGPRLYQRELEVYVQLVVDGDVDVDDRIDDLADEVEVAIEADPTLGALAGVADTELDRIEGPELSSDGSRIVAMAALVYRVTYEREFLPEGGPLGDFTGGELEIDSHDPREGAEATETFDVETA
jgi:hypothetical protein